MKPSSHVLQPIYAENGSVIFSEILSRFGLANTQDTILQAEKDGSIVQIDIASLEFGRTVNLPVSVNISNKTIESSSREIIEKIYPGVIVEITETYPSQINLLELFARNVRLKGCGFALDDVGCGEFSDIDWLNFVIKKTSPDWLKLSINSDDSLISWCLSQKIPIIVEKIETLWDLRLAIEFGAKGFQGWFFDTQQGVLWLRKQRNGIEYRVYEKFVLAAA